jgi:nitroreductase
MDIPIASWSRAVFQRKSRRSFLADRPIAEDLLTRLEHFCREFRPFSDARVEIVRHSPEGVLKGLVGGYGRITGAPDYAVMIGTSNSPSAGEHVGYLGEALILEATALGLGTCWVSGMFRLDEVRKQIVPASGERVYAITPLGYGERTFTAKEKLYIAVAGSGHRKPLKDLHRGSSPLPWQIKALESARLSPSARNRQPWRFEIVPEAITIRLDAPPDGDRYPKRLDCGIAMLHLELGATSEGAPGHWIFLDTPGVARYEKKSEPVQR